MASASNRADAKILSAKVDAIISVSKGVAKDLCETLRIPDECIHAIYNAVFNQTLVEQSFEAVEHYWFSDSDIPVILEVGKLKPQKDYGTLLKALAKVRVHKEVRLVILGHGPMLADLKSLAQELNIADGVSLEGFVQNPFKFMRQADLFVLSSRYEGLPGVLIQALACGCPVVSTDCPSGHGEILENEQYGSLVPVADVDTLANAILAQLDTQHDRLLLKRRGRSFSEEEAVKNYRNVLLPT